MRLCGQAFWHVRKYFEEGYWRTSQWCFKAYVRILCTAFRRKVKDAQEHRGYEDVLELWLSSLRHRYNFPTEPQTKWQCSGKNKFSEKKKLHRYKVEVSVMSSGLTTRCAHYHGSIAEVEIFCQISEFQNKVSKHYVWELDFVHKELFEHHEEDFWAIFGEKGYQGASDSLRVIKHIQAHIHGVFAANQLEHNQNISSDRIIFKNYFESMSSLWTVLSQKFRWHTSIYDKVAQFFLPTTSWYMRSHPLREVENAYFVGVCNRIRTTAAREAEKRRIIST